MTLNAVTPSRVESRSVTPSKVRAVVEAVGGLGISVLAHDSGKPGRRVEHAIATQEAEIQCEIRAEPDGAPGRASEGDGGSFYNRILIIGSSELHQIGNQRMWIDVHFRICRAETA